MIASDHILNKINKYFNNISTESHNAIIGDDGFQYFATSIKFIVEAVNLIKEREELNKKFLDVGSGIGNICGVAELMGLCAEGIELNPVLFNISKQIYPEIKFHNLDMREFKNYGDYDIIFYFTPIANPEALQNLKEKIENEIRVGGYIIVRDAETKDDRFISIDTNDIKNHVWQKIRT